MKDNPLFESQAKEAHQVAVEVVEEPLIRPQGTQVFSMRQAKEVAVVAAVVEAGC